jgi:two-component system, LytTR family, sensor kinase
LYFVKNLKCKPLGSPQQRKIAYLQNNFTPYFLITLFAGCTALLRVYLMPEWAWWQHLLSFSVQTVSLIGIWQLIRLLNRLLERNISFERGPIVRMFAQSMLTLIILSPIVFAVVMLGRPYMPSYINKQFIAITIMLFVMIVFLFNFTFYAGYFYTNWQVSVEEKAQLEVQAAELERETFNLQYHQLKNQVNPHYLFNMLTSLDGLIHTNPDLASDFVRHMSKVYRYVLQHKENEVVSMDEELEFISHYVELLQIRYGAGISIEHSISTYAAEKGIVMITLQMLIDNAIKHNSLQVNAPLVIKMWDENGYLNVQNNKQLKKQMDTSNGQGIVQLKKLYTYLTHKKIYVEETEELYTLKLPLL